MKTVFSPITVGTISKSLKGTMQVELRQTVTRIYDGVKTSNSLSDALFSPEEMGVEGQKYDEIRVTWKGVPATATSAIVEAQLAKFPEARIAKILSYSVVLTDDQENVYKNGLRGDAFANFIATHKLTSTTWDKTCQDKLIEVITDAQLVKYGKNNAEGKPENEAVLFNGKPQYRVLSFVTSAVEDKDLRIERAVTESIDLAPVTANQEEKVAA